MSQDNNKPFIQLGDITLRLHNLVCANYGESRATLILSSLDCPSFGMMPVANETMSFEKHEPEYTALWNYLRTHPSFVGLGEMFLNLEQIIYADHTDEDSLLLVVNAIDPAKYEGRHMAHKEIIVAAGADPYHQISEWLAKQTVVLVPRQKQIVEQVGSWVGVAHEKNRKQRVEKAVQQEIATLMEQATAKPKGDNPIAGLAASWLAAVRFKQLHDFQQNQGDRPEPEST